MTKKQKKVLYRIVVSGILYAVLLVLFHTGLVKPEELFENERYGRVLELCLYVIVYAVIGGDIVKKAVVNIGHGQVFDENFLMCAATFGAFGIGEYSEAVAVMLFYQVVELFQSYAVNRSRQSITELMDICPEYANVEVDDRVEQKDPDEVVRRGKTDFSTNRAALRYARVLWKKYNCQRGGRKLPYRFKE